MKETNKILIINDNNEEKECDVLFTFDSETTKKSYLVYTDNTKDEMGNIKIYANTYNKEKTDGELGSIDTEEEWATIEQIFSSMNEKSD